MTIAIFVALILVVTIPKRNNCIPNPSICHSPNSSWSRHTYTQPPESVQNIVVPTNTSSDDAAESSEKDPTFNCDIPVNLNHEVLTVYVCIFGFKGASTSHVIGARNEMRMDDNDGQMIFGDLVCLKLPDIRLTGEDKPRKTSPRKHVPTGDQTRARCVTSAHATTRVLTHSELSDLVRDLSLTKDKAELLATI